MVNGFLTFSDDDAANRFWCSADAEELARQAELKRSFTQPMVIITGLPEETVDFVRVELARRWSAKFIPSRRYAPVAV